MPRLLLVLGAALAALVLFSTDAQAQNIQIFGTVKDADGKPLSGVQVVAVSSSEGRGKRQVKTDNDGAYKLPFLEFGNYRVKAYKDGMIMLTIAVSSKTRQGQVDFETKGEVGPKQEIPEYNFQPGRIIAYDFVMVPAGYYDTVVTGDDAGAINAAITEANRLTAEGRWDESDAVLEPVMAKAAKFASPWLLKGVNAAGRGQNAEAEAFLTKALELDPNMKGVRAQLGQVAYAAGDKKKAIAWFDQEIELSPENVPVLINRAIAIAESGTREEALAAWQGVVERAPTEASAYTEVATIYTDMGQEEKAIEVLKRMEEVAKPNAASWFNIGANLANRDQLDKALPAYLKALELDPNLAEANREVGYVLLRQGEPAKALPYLERYIAARPNADDTPGLVKIVERLRADASKPAAAEPAPKPAPKPKK